MLLTEKKKKHSKNIFLCVMTEREKKEYACGTVTKQLDYQDVELYMRKMIGTI
jgi:hypothetical protein